MSRREFWSAVTIYQYESLIFISDLGCSIYLAFNLNPKSNIQHKKDRSFQNGLSIKPNQLL